MPGENRFWLRWRFPIYSINSPVFFITENVDGDEFPEMEAEKNPEGDSGVENEEDRERERKAKEEKEKEENLKTLFKGCKFFLGREVNRLVGCGAFLVDIFVMNSLM